MEVVNSVYDSGAAAVIQVDNHTAAISAPGVAGISDCGGADVFLVNNVAGNSITANALSRAYDPINRAQVGRFNAVRYFIRDNTEGIPSLFRVTFATNSNAEMALANQEELVDGVQGMQILYGVDADSDGVPDQFLAAGAAGLTTRNDWLSVISVRIALLMRTVDGIGQLTDSNIYEVGDVRHCRAGIAPAPNPVCAVTWPTDNFRRRVFQTTISIRNS